MGVTRAWWKGERGSCCFMGIDFQIYKIKMFWRSISQQYEHNTTELYIHLKMLRW